MTPDNEEVKTEDVKVNPADVLASCPVDPSEANQCDSCQ